MWSQIIGAGCFVAGLLIVIGFPDISEYQPESMSRFGVIIGIGLMILGLYLMKT